MDNQEIVFINRDKNVIIVQGKTVSYQETLENFATDYGSAVPSYIQKLDICKDTGLKMLNGSVITEKTEHGADAIAYADTLIPLAQALQDAKEARENPPAPEPTEEELAIQAKQEEIAEAKQYLNETDYAVIKCMENGLDLETEYPGLKAKRQAARDTVNSSEAQVQVLAASIAEASNV